MSLYVLTVFLETPEPQRKGRKRYIVASFMITVLFSFTASLDMANYFQSLFQSTSPSHWLELSRLKIQNWKYGVGYTAAGLYIAVGDALLVGECLICVCLAVLTEPLSQVYRCYIICVEDRWVTILPAMATLSSLGPWRASFKTWFMLIGTPWIHNT
jgi:hypothetical protein